MDEQGLSVIAIEIEAEVGLHAECMRGRSGYQSGVRPNHWIPGRSYCFVGEIQFDKDGKLEPGQKGIARIHCLIPEQDKKLFVPNLCWHITEAGRIMGYAKVLRVL